MSCRTSRSHRVCCALSNSRPDYVGKVDALHLELCDGVGDSLFLWHIKLLHILPHDFVERLLAHTNRVFHLRKSFTKRVRVGNTGREVGIPGTIEMANQLTY